MKLQTVTGSAYPQDHNEIIAQLRTLRAGASVVYHVGLLALDREGMDADGVRFTAREAWGGYQGGRFVLLQRRLAACSYEYIAVGRRV